MCSVDGCDKKSRARGMCPMHYRRWKLYGDPTRVQVIRDDDAARFWSHVDKTGPCWLWTGALTSDGYGRFRLRDSHVMAHRWSYEQAIGAIPDGMVLDHVVARGCANRNCVNPAHLEPVTTRENLMRGDTLTAANAAKTECPHGHPYEGANVVTYSGRRHCRQCISNRNAMARRTA